MAGKDCNCGKTTTHEVDADPVPDTERDGAFQAVYVTADWADCLAHARETLGLNPGEGTAKTIIDLMCTALTTCRAEKQLLATEVDKAHEALEECQDELSVSYEDDADDGDDESIEGEETDGIQTTTNVSGPPLSAALRARLQAEPSGEKPLRQDNSVQQPGRSVQWEMFPDGISRVQPPGHVHDGSSVRGSRTDGVPALRRVSSTSVAGSTGRAELPVLRGRVEHQLGEQRDPGDVLPGQDHDSADVRRPVLPHSSNATQPGDVRMRERRVPALASTVRGDLRVSMARERQKEVAVARPDASRERP